MALQHLRSSTANKRPLPANMADGQVAVNTNTSSPGLFVKDSASGLLKIGPTHIGSTAPNVSPASGGATGNTVGEQWLDTASANPLLKIWDGSAWKTVQPVATGTVVTTTDVGTITSGMILDETITNVDISTTAAIAHSKLASITAGRVLLGNSSNVPTATELSGDVTVTSAGVTTVSNGAITNAKVATNAAIVDTKLATISTAGKVSNSATTATNGNTVNTIVLRDASGNFSAGTISAAIIGNVTGNLSGKVSFPLGTAALPSLYPGTDTNTGIFSPGADQVAISTNGTNRLHIASDGKVGLGTSSPNELLEVTGNIHMSGAADRTIFNRANNALSLGTNNTARLHITNAGNVGIGTTSPGNTLHVQADVTAGNLVYFNNTNATASNVLRLNTLGLGTGTYIIDAQSGGTSRFVVNGLGNVGIGTSSPAGLMHLATTGEARLIIDGDTSNLPAEEGALIEFKTDGGLIRHRIEAKGSANELEIISGAADTTVAGINTGITFYTKTAGLAAAAAMRVDPTGRVGIGSNSPQKRLHVVGDSNDSITTGASAIRAYSADSTAYCETNYDGINATITTNPSAAKIAFAVNGTERTRIDRSGRLLIGTSTARFVGGTQNKVQIEGTDAAASSMSFVRNSNDGSPPSLRFAKSNGSTIGSNTAVTNNTQAGAFSFYGNDGSSFIHAANIACEVDGTPGTNDMPGRLVFSTTADGAASPTERLRITSAGVLQVADAGNITVGTTTGTKIGTGTTQKIGFYNATPVVQPAAVADATTAVDVITQLNDLLAKLRTLGIIAT